MNIIDLHKSAWEQLNARRDRLPHALLFTGQRAIGKSELAQRFVDALLCENPTAEHTACGACVACGWLAQGNHPDFRRIQPDALTDEEGKGEGESTNDGASGKKKPSQQITINQIRALDDFLHVGTHRQGARVILINPAEAMNRSTANALLKSLEEPSSNTLFILVSNEPDRLLPTIRSRCQVLAVATPDSATAERWLTDNKVADGALWLALSGGAPLLAQNLAQSDERVLLDAMVDELKRGATINPLSAAAALDRIVKAEKRSAPLKRLIEWAQKWLTDLTLASQGLPPRFFLAHTDTLKKQSAASDPARILAFSRKALQYKAQCEQPLNSRLFLEDFFLGFAAVFRPDARRP